MEISAVLGQGYSFSFENASQVKADVQYNLLHHLHALHISFFEEQNHFHFTPILFVNGSEYVQIKNKN